MGGALLTTESPLPLDTELTLEVTPPGAAAPIAIAGRVSYHVTDRRLGPALHQPRRRRRSPAARAHPPAARVVTGGGPPGKGAPRKPYKWRGAPRALETRSAQQAIRAALAFRGISDQIRAERLIAEWTELVGPKIAARTRPERIHERVLYIEVASSAWLHELNLLRAQILSGLIERLGEPRLFDELKFRLAGRTGRDRPAPQPRARIRPPPPRPEPVPATGLAREQIVREAETVDDDELRDLIARVRIANDR